MVEVAGFHHTMPVLQARVEVEGPLPLVLPVVLPWRLLLHHQTTVVEVAVAAVAEVVVVEAEAVVVPVVAVVVVVAVVLVLVLVLVVVRPQLLFLEHGPHLQRLQPA